MREARKTTEPSTALLTVRMSYALKERIEEIAKAAKLSPSTVAKNILESILQRVDDRLDVTADRARILELERLADEAKAFWKHRVKEVEEQARSVAEKLEAAGLIKRMEPQLEAIIQNMKSKQRAGTEGRRRGRK
jgi:predicted transcriptional regulator